MLTSLLSTSGASGDISALIAKLRAANAPLHREVLDNGLVCLVKPDRSAPVVAVQIWVGTGAIHEDENLGAGLSHYMEHMIFKGTPTRGPADITREIDEAGGEINAYTSHDRTVFYADLPSRNWKVGVDVLSDAVMNAALPEDEWQREKEVILREFAMGKDSPQRVHSKLLYDTAYRVHPYRVPVIGYEDVFNTMTRDDLAAFFHEHYVPDNMIVSIVGDVDTAEVMQHLKDTFRDFKRRARKPVVLPGEPEQLTPRLVRSEGSYQVGRLHWTYHTVNLEHPDAPALDVLALILGDGRSSVFNRELREKQQLVHSVSVWSHTPAEAGLFGISATYDPENEAAVLEAIREQIEASAASGFTTDVIEKAKRNQAMGELSTLQTMSGQCSSYAAGEYYAGNPRFSEFYLEELATVDEKRLLDVMRRYILEAHESVAILAPEAAEAGNAENVSNIEYPMHRITLSNGMPLIVREDHRLPFLHVSVAMRGGLLSENEAINGITQLAADLLTRGTAERTSEEIAEDLESRGASISGFSGRNSFGLNAHGLAEDADMLLASVAECLLTPTFPDTELQKLKATQLAALRQQREQPMFLAQEQLRNQLFPGHPYRLNTLGTEASIEAITREQIRDYYTRHLAADNAVISIFGDISAEQAKELGEKYLASVTGASSHVADWNPAQPELPSSQSTDGPFEQAILLMGYPGVDLADPRADALTVLQRALSGLSSELAIEIREKRGLVYFVGALSMSGVEPGLFAFYAGTTAEQADEVETLIQEQVARICENGLRQDEFDRARAQLIASSDMSLQNTGELAQMCALNELYGLGYAYTFTLPDRLNAMQPEDIIVAAKSVFDSTKLAVSRIVPEAESREP